MFLKIIQYFLINDKFLVRKVCPKTTRMKQKPKQSKSNQDCWKTEYGTKSLEENTIVRFR